MENINLGCWQDHFIISLSLMNEFVSKSHVLLGYWARSGGKTSPFLDECRPKSLFIVVYFLAAVPTVPISDLTLAGSLQVVDFELATATASSFS